MSVEDADQILSTLQTLASQQRLKEGASLSEDGNILNADGTAFAARTMLTLAAGDKSCTYTAAAVYLLIIDPSQRYLTYRSACKKLSVAEIKVPDQPIVVEYFFGAPEVTAEDSSEQPAPAAAAVAAPPEAPEGEKRESSSSKEHRHHKSSSSRREHRDHRSSKDKESSKRKKDHHHKSSSKHRADEAAASDKKKKAKPTTVTNEELFSNLDVVVGKRTTDPFSSAEDDKATITAALSAEGFDVTPELLEEHRETTQHLMANEIPVGDSASILRAANPRKDLSRVLEIFNETVNPKKVKPSAAVRTAKKPVQKSYLVGKKPVIVVPKGMTTPLTMINAHEFFSKGRYIPRDVILKQQRESGGASRASVPTTFTRQLGGTAGATNPGLLEYEITDNPKRLLGGDPKEWERIVAVLVLGQKWQFADWLFNYSNPVHLFTKTFGFFVILEGDKIPDDVKGWSVRHAKLNRDKRGMDSMTSAAFWNGLDEFMSVHKRELLPQVAED